MKIIAKHLKRLAFWGEYCLRESLSSQLKNLEKMFNEIEYGDSNKSKESLKLGSDSFKIACDNFSKYYGITFSEINEEYNNLLPKINEYLSKH